MKRRYNFDNKFLDWMEKIADYYHQCLLKNETAIKYLHSRGIISAEAITTFRIGFCDGSFSKTLNEEDRNYLFKVRLLYDNGKEKLHNYVVFPLWDKDLPQINNFYGRNISQPRHFYLQNTSRSLFNPSAIEDTEEVIITESIIDSLAIWSAGLKNVIPIYGATGLTKAILNHLKANKIKHVVLILDSDVAGKNAAKSISLKLVSDKIKTRIIEMPNVKDISEFISLNTLTQEGQAKLKKQFRELGLFSDKATKT